MIEKIGVLCQDPNSFGFVLGLKRRLGCKAELFRSTTGSLTKSTEMTRSQARLAWAILSRERVDLVIRFTDADGQRWQEVKRREIDVFPKEVESLLVCGVAENNTEQWLALDASYIEDKLDLKPNSLSSPESTTGSIKNAIALKKPADKAVHEVTAKLVNDAPHDVFQNWLKNSPSLRDFYSNCRAAALRAGCKVPPNELDDLADDAD